MAYSSDIVDLHIPVSLGNKWFDTPSTALVLLHPQAMHHFPDTFFSRCFYGHSESVIYSASSLSIDNSWSNANKQQCYQATS